MDIYGGQGYVDLLYTIPDSTGTFESKDFFIAQAAGTSHMSYIENDKQVEKLISNLFSWGHFSPFEQASLTFEIKAPAVVFWQLDRHRTFRYGSHLRRSGRYTKYFAEDFYIPEYFDMYEMAQLGLTIEHGLELYNAYIDSGMKSESARYFLPGWCMLYTEVMNVDLKNLMHFFSLRLDPAAQIEIRELANAMFELTKKEFPISMKYFEEHEKPRVDYITGDTE